MAKILMIESYQSNRQYFWIDSEGLKYLFHRILTKEEAGPRAVGGGDVDRIFFIYSKNIL